MCVLATAVTPSAVSSYLLNVTGVAADIVIFFPLHWSTPAQIRVSVGRVSVGSEGDETPKGEDDPQYPASEGQT